jgi:hypothetical protein
MSMAEILGMLNEKAKEDNNKHSPSPWTRMVLEKDLLKGLRTVIVIEYAKTMRQKKRREHGKQRRV